MSNSSHLVFDENLLGCNCMLIHNDEGERQC